MVGEGLVPAAWTAKFGSVTFNQYGREFPNGGMNRAGLAMHALWLDGTSYPKSDGPAIEALQWIQYCLDSYKTVGEVAESARTMAISSPASLHFFACDAAGSCAVIEFLDGAPVIRAGDELPLPLLTNSTYAGSIAALDRSLGYPWDVNAGVDTRSWLARGNPYLGLGWGLGSGRKGPYLSADLGLMYQRGGLSAWGCPGFI